MRQIAISNSVFYEYKGSRSSLAKMNKPRHESHYPDGTPRAIGQRIDWNEVEGPISQDFLDSVSRKLATDFALSQFPKRRSNALETT
jgi:hypothetical protein